MEVEDEEPMSDYDLLRQRNIDQRKKMMATEFGDIQLLKHQIITGQKKMPKPKVVASDPPSTSTRSGISLLAYFSSFDSLTVRYFVKFSRSHLGREFNYWHFNSLDRLYKVDLVT